MSGKESPVIYYDDIVLPDIESVTSGRLGKTAATAATNYHSGGLAVDLVK